MLFSTKPHKEISLLAALIVFVPGADLFAQGEDGTKAERNNQIIAEMLSGQYDNANQAYFDQRLKLPDGQRHTRMSATVKRVDAPRFGEAVFLTKVVGSDEDSADLSLVYVLEADNAANAVRMKTFELKSSSEKKLKKRNASYLEGCDILWREEAGQFHGAIENASACGDDVNLPSDLFLSEDALWMNFSANEENHFVMERARQFSCYVDVPGVGGGRDIPYKRYSIEDIHDKGGKSWVMLDDGMEISISLQNIRWPMNNMNNIFTRHSFVMYVGKREGDEVKEVSYTWTVPDAQRIGLNLKWMLVNCYMLSNEEVTPFFKEEPKL